jgi:hypothetical protein
MHSFIFGIAAVIGIGSVAYSVKNAQAQKFPGYTMLWMTPIVNAPEAQNIAFLSDNPVAQQEAANQINAAQANATQAHLGVTNHQGVPEQYELKFLKNGKVTSTWNIILNDGQTWQRTIAWSSVKYSMLADLYLLPNTKTPFHYVNNGNCEPSLKALSPALRPEDPCDGKS